MSLTNYFRAFIFVCGGPEAFSRKYDCRGETIEAYMLNARKMTKASRAYLALRTGIPENKIASKCIQINT